MVVQAPPAAADAVPSATVPAAATLIVVEPLSGTLEQEQPVEQIVNAPSAPPPSLVSREIGKCFKTKKALFFFFPPSCTFFRNDCLAMDGFRRRDRCPV